MSGEELHGEAVPTILLGGAGYVAGELLRLVAGHPGLRLEAALSATHAGQSVAALFPHLAGVLADQRFTDRADEGALQALFHGVRDAGHGRVALFSAAPHGASAAQIDGLLTAADEAGLAARLVDLSADFRFPTAAAYEAVYGGSHAAPARLGQFTCALPEHSAETPPAGHHVGHPGCFTTAVTLATVPLLALDWVEPELFVSAVTGSTGSGRTPGDGTHHPERQSNLWAYSPLVHRHVPEMTRLAREGARSRNVQVDPKIAFVPHSGPFARGIHATVQARLRQPRDHATLTAELASFYADAPFVEVLDRPPRLKEVVGTNRCRLALAVGESGTLAVFSVIDNLVKGAAGGAVHWMNRLLDLPETSGLLTPGLGWT